MALLIFPERYMCNFYKLSSKPTCTFHTLIIINNVSMSLFFIIKTEVSPPNVYVSMGSTLELNCTIEKDYSPYRLMFIFNQKEVHPPESSRAQNNSIVLRKVIQSVEEGGDYSCYKNDKKVGSSTVEVVCRWPFYIL